MNAITDGIKVWCLRCAARHFVGLSEIDCTEENLSAFQENVQNGSESDKRGGTLEESFASGACADCGVILQASEDFEPFLLN